MTNKVATFLLEKFPAISAFTKQEIQTLESSMAGAEGTAKKAALDEKVIGFINTAIEAYNISLLPDPIEKGIIDPFLEKEVAKYVPEITQEIYNIFDSQLVKVENSLPAAPTPPAA